MKKHFIFIIGILLFTNAIAQQNVSAESVGNANNLQLSFNLGKSFLYTYAEGSYSYFDEDSYYLEEITLISSPFVPTVVSASVYSTYQSGISLRINGGFGFATNKIEDDQPKQTFIDPDGEEHNIDKEKSKYSYKLSGFNFGGAILYPVAIDNKEKLLIYPGIGIGYYHYWMAGTWESEYTYYEIDETGPSFKEKTLKTNGDFEKSEISGLAQTFILGLEFKVNKSTSFILEFEKLGYHLLKVTEDEDYVDGKFRKKIAEEKTTQESFPGLVDVGVTFGVKIGL